MRINGQWHLGKDSVYRPTISGALRLASGEWKVVHFLIDTGADRTVFDASLLGPLQGSKPSPTSDNIAGIGGSVSIIDVQTTISFLKDDGDPIIVNGSFAVFTRLENSDMSILGRDVTNNFVVICDYPARQVCLLHPPHRYSIAE